MIWPIKKVSSLKIASRSSTRYEARTLATLTKRSKLHKKQPKKTNMMGTKSKKPKKLETRLMPLGMKAKKRSSLKSKKL